MSSSRDTSAAASARYIELMRQRTPRDRAVILAGLCTSARRLAFEGERAAHPQLSDRAIEARVVVRLYGAAVAAKYFPDVHIG
jgi:hypothetical protein